MLASYDFYIYDMMILSFRNLYRISERLYIPGFLNNGSCESASLLRARVSRSGVFYEMVGIKK